jgi:hypothetical protein
MKKNNVAGTWNLISACMDNHGKRLDVLGAQSSGMVIFNEDLRFIIVINNPDIPKFVAGDCLKGTPEEYKTAVANYKITKL